MSWPRGSGAGQYIQQAVAQQLAGKGWPDREGAWRAARKRVLSNVAVYGDAMAQTALKRPLDLVYLCGSCGLYHMVSYRKG